MNIEEVMSGSFSGVEPQLDIAVGERVRSYDFGGRRDCYAEGVVEAIAGPIEGCLRYQLRIERRVFEGAELLEHEGTVFPPVNGTRSLNGKRTNLVERVTQH